MKGFKAFSVFAAFALTTVFSYLVRDSVAEKSYAGDLERFHAAEVPPETKPLPFTGEAAEIAAVAWRSFHAVDGRRSEFPVTAGHHETLDGGKLLLARFLAHAYGVGRVFSGGSSNADEKPVGFDSSVPRLSESADFIGFIKTFFRVWAAILSGLVFLCVYVLTRNRLSAALGGLAHAVSPAAVFAPALSPTPANFAVPLAAVSLIFGVWSVRRPDWRKNLLSAAGFTAAAVFWSGAWVFSAFWGMAELIDLAIGGRASRARGRLWLALNAAAVAAVFAASMTRGIPIVDFIAGNPFLLTGPAVPLAHWLSANSASKKPFLKVLSCVGACAVVWVCALFLSRPGAVFAAPLRLLLLKMEFLNVKPSDPSLLAFTDRLLWEDAERSVGIYAVRLFFPVFFFFSTAAILAAAVSSKLRSRLVKWFALVNPVPVMALAAFAAFLFFERFHCAAAFFTSAFAGCAFFFWSRNARLLDLREGIRMFLVVWGGLALCAFAQSGGKLGLGALAASSLAPWRILSPPIMTAAVSVLLVGTMSKASRSRKLSLLVIFISAATCLVAEFRIQSSVPMARRQDPERAVLLDWISSENASDAKFAGLPDLAPLLESYAGAECRMPPRPLHVPRNAEKYRELLDLTYGGTESELAEFLAENKVDYLIFDSAEALLKNLYASRYLAAAVNIPPLAPASLMSSRSRREALKCFFEIKPPKEYAASLGGIRVFKVVSRKNRSDAVKWALESERLARTGDNFAAARFAKSAVFADPNCEIADIMYRKLYKRPPLIRLRGF